jgi:two-component system, NarL family, sensor kinase
MKAIHYCFLIICILHLNDYLKAGPGAYTDSILINTLMDRAYELEFTFPDSAIFLYHEAALLAEKNNDLLRLGQTHNYRAIVYFEQGDYDQALVHNQQALEYFEMADYSVGVASIKINIGNIRLFTGAFDVAVKLYYEGLQLLEGVSDTLRLAISYMNIGTLFYRNQYYNEALDYNLQALTWANKLGRKELLAELHINTANIFSSLNDDSYYRMYIDSALVFSRIENYVFGNLLAYNSLANYFNTLAQPDSALYYSLLAAEAAIAYGNPGNITEVYNLLGLNYLNAGNTDSAVVYLNKAGFLAKSHNLLPLLADSKYRLSKVYEQMGDYRKALENLNEYTLLHDSLFAIEKQRELQEMDRRYRIAQKDDEIQQQGLNLELKEKEIRRKNILITSTTVFIVLIVSITFLLAKYFRNKEKLAKKELERITLERETHIIKALLEGEEKERRRIAHELHDGVNGNLAALKLNLSACKNSQFDGILDKTMDEVRNLSHNLMPDVVKNFGLQVALDQYISGIKSVHNWKIDYQFIGNASVIKDEVSMHVYRIIQELVSNSMKHSDGDELLVQIIINEGKLSITIEDNGKGFDAGLTASNGNGIGLLNVENRITYLKGQFDIHSSTQNGTSVNIEIPLYVNKLS